MTRHVWACLVWQSGIFGMTYSMQEVVGKDGTLARHVAQLCCMHVAVVTPHRWCLSWPVFLVESLDADHEEMKHLKAVVYCRPTPENFEVLKRIVQKPKFGEYNLCTWCLSGSACGARVTTSRQRHSCV